MKIRGNTIATPIARHAVTDDSVVSKKPWSSQNTVDKLCPDLSKTGSAVRCEPVEGYPLEVVASEEATQIIRCGKNIFDIATAGVYHTNANSYWCDMYVTETGLRLEPIKGDTSAWSVFGFYLGTAKELAGKTITVSGRVNTTTSIVPKPFVRTTSVEPTSVRNKPTYKDGGYVGIDTKSLKEGSVENGYGTVTYTVTGEEQYPYIAILFQLTYGGSYEVGDWTEWSDIQVEIGESATAYEPYNGDTFAPNEPITALKGVNTLYADSGEITVKGKADTTNILKAVSYVYELIEDITLEEDVLEIIRDTDINGTSYDFSAIRVVVDVPAASGQAQIGISVYGLKEESAHFYLALNGSIATAKRKSVYIIRNDRGFVDNFAANDSNSNLSTRVMALSLPWKNIAKIRAWTYPSTVLFPAGTNIKIYGIRG